MRPVHEQVWKRDLDRAGVVHVTPDITLVCKVDISRLLGDEAATLREVEVLMGAVVALPDMARALLGLLSEGKRRDSETVERHTARCWEGVYAYLMKDGCSDDGCKAAHAALRKAGVI